MQYGILHERALGLAKEYRSSEAALLGVLSEMQGLSAFYSLGYTGIFEYCVSALGLSEAQAYYFQKVARKSVEVPELKAAVEDGTLTLSMARRIEPVITRENAPEWIEKAATLKQKALENEVQLANPEAKGSREKSHEKTLRRLMNVLGKSRNEVLSLALEQLADRVDPERMAARAAVSSRKPQTVRILTGRRAIPAVVKHAVVRTQGYRCAECDSARFLQYHHKTPVAQGGLSLPSNLEILCSAHHAIRHRGPRFTSPRPCAT